MTENKNIEVVLKAYVGKGNFPTADHFEVRECPTPTAGEEEIVLQTLYLSVDPYMRMRMNKEKSYAPPYALNKPCCGSGCGRVVESRNAKYQVGDLLTSQLSLSYPWQRFVKMDDATAKK